jgi:phenylacetate-CoA ligase
LFARFLVRNACVLKKVCPSLKLGIVTSEVCTDEDRSILGQAFGVPVVREYGASEVGIISFENAHGEWINSEETLFIEVADENGRGVGEGVPGDILVTDLFNQAMPFLRYRIGDVGSICRKFARGSDSRSRLLRLEGRTNDIVVLPSGRKSPGLTFYYISRSILESSGCLREFIIRQTALDEFAFDVVSDRELRPEEIRQIEEKMELYLEPGLRLKVNRVPAIKRPASGKIKHFYSEIN